MGCEKETGLVQFLLFNAVGLFNTAFCYAIYVVLVYSGIHYFLALLIDYAVGGIISFTLNKKITFRHDGRVTLIMISRMVVSIMLVFMLNLLTLMVLVESFELGKILSQFIALIVVAISSFFMQKKFVFYQQL